MLLSFAAPVATTYVILKIQKKQVRREVKWKMIAGIDREELELIKLTKQEAQEDLRWEHSKEFEYNGEMYDIVETIEKGDSIFYWCWWDYEETQLNKQLDSVLALAYKKDHRSHRNQERMAVFYKSVYFFDSHEIKLAEATELENPPVGYFRIFQSHSLSPPVPPPEVV